MWSPFGVHYAWLIAGIAFVMNLGSGVLSPNAFAFFMIPMSDELGWGRTDMSWALTARLLVAGLAGPALGSLIDRHGTRWLGAAAGIVAGASLIALAFVKDLPFLYLTYGLAGLGGFGGVAGALLTTVPIGKWFTHRRGAAMALATTGIPFGGAIAVASAQWLISTIGWRDAWIVFGVAVIVLVVPSSVLFMRRTPEDHGLLPYGEDRPLDVADVGATMEIIHGTAWTRAEALRAPATWVIVAAIAIGGLTLVGTVLYRPAYFHDLGVPAPQIAAGIALDPVMVVFSTLFFGAMAERLGIRLLGLLAGLGFAASLIPMIVSRGQPESVFIHALVWGSIAGSWFAINNLVWVSYYGRRSLGAIQGVVMPVLLVANGLGGPVYGGLLGGGLDPRVVWTGAATVLVFSGVLLFLVRPPTRVPRE